MNRGRLLWGILACLAAGAFAFPAYAAAPTWVGAGAQGQSTSTTCTPTTPASIQNNDILITVTSAWGPANLTINNGFTEKIEGNATNTDAATIRIGVAYKRTSGTEGATTITGAGATYMLCRMFAIRGAVTAGDPFDIAGAIESNQDNGEQTNFSTASVTTVTNDAMTFHLVAHANGSYHGNWGGNPITERMDFVHSVSQNLGIAMASGTKAAAGALGAATATAEGPYKYFSGSVQFAIKPAASVAAPNAPGDPTYTSVANSSVRVNWTAPGAGDPPTSYKLERAPDNAGAPGAWGQIAGGVTNLYYDDSGLASNTKYWYRVRGTNAGGDGAYSNATSVTTLADTISVGYIRWVCSAPDGNCFAVKQNGGRVDYGSGANDYAKSNGTSVQFGSGISPGTPAHATQAGRVFMGSGAPNNADGANGDFYFRTDTPGSVNQRLYVKSAGAWAGIL